MNTNPHTPPSLLLTIEHWVLCLSRWTTKILFALWNVLMISLAILGISYLESNWNQSDGKNIGGAILIAVAVVGILWNRRLEATPKTPPTTPKN